MKYLKELTDAQKQAVEHLNQAIYNAKALGLILILDTSENNMFAVNGENVTELKMLDWLTEEEQEEENYTTADDLTQKEYMDIPSGEDIYHYDLNFDKLCLMVKDEE